jgi:hypothetical protein
MLIYTTIFLTSLIVAAVILVVYRKVSDSSRSVYSSKERIAIISHPVTDQADKAARNPVAGSQAAREQPRRTTPQNLSQPYPDTSPGPINLGRKGSRDQVSEPDLSHAGAVSVSHCSLYDVSTPDSTSGSNRSVDWSFSEKKRESGANVHKAPAPRKVSTASSDPETSGKPWGW